MQVQKINNSTSFGLYSIGVLSKSHAEILAPLTPKLSEIGKKVNLRVSSDRGVIQRGSDYQILLPCIKISAWKKDSLYPITHTGDAFLKGENPQEEILQVASKVAEDALRPLPKNA